MYKMKEYSKDISQHSTLIFEPFSVESIPLGQTEREQKRETELKFPPTVYLCVYRP